MNTRFFFVIEFLAKKPMHNPTDTSHSTNTTQAIYLTFNVFAMHVMAQAIASWNKTRDVKPRKVRNRFIACKIISKCADWNLKHEEIPRDMTFRFLDIRCWILNLNGYVAVTQAFQKVPEFAVSVLKVDASRRPPSIATMYKETASSICFRHRIHM